MNEEEKKSVEFIKDLIYWEVGIDMYTNKEECEKLETILNLIEKLQKENEELKERIREHTLLISPYYVKENFISVQRVKDKIEELDIKISECEYSDDDDEEYKKAVEKDKLFLLNQKRVLQELLEKRK